jgi:hypothetical protein
MTEDISDQVAIAFGIAPREKGDRRLDGDAIIGLLRDGGAMITKLTGLGGPRIVRDVADCIAEVLELRLREIAIGAWNQRAEIRKYTDTKAYPPDRDYRLRLKEHTITWTYRPYIEVTAAGLSKKIPLKATAAFTFSGPLLLIRAGRYRAIEFGEFKVAGGLELGGVTLTKQASRPYRLAGRVMLGAQGIPIASLQGGAPADTDATAYSRRDAIPRSVEPYPGPHGLVQGEPGQDAGTSGVSQNTHRHGF